MITKSGWSTRAIIEQLFDTESMRRPLNEEIPASVPQRPMGEIPVIVRLVWPDGEEWRPGIREPLDRESRAGPLARRGGRA